MTAADYRHYDWNELIERGIVEQIGYSDYSGDLVDRANIEWIKRNWKHHRDYYCIPTIYSGEMCYIFRNKHTIESLDALQDYPLFDDEIYNALEYEIIIDAMEQFKQDYELRDTERVNNALFLAMSENGYPQPNWWDYSDSDVMRDFIKYYKKAIKST